MKKQFSAQKQTKIFTIILAICKIFIGCCTNVIVLELMLNQDSKCGGFITAIQFLVISIQGLFQNLSFKDGIIKLKPRVIPLWIHVLLVIFFFGSTIINNIAFGYKISLPLHSIFRSSSLAMNMILGILFFKLRQSKEKVLSVIAVTIGIALTTYFSSTSTKQVFNEEFVLSDWLIGIGLLTIGSILSSLLGNFQELAATKYGKVPEEIMFYSNVLSLPFFLFMVNDLNYHLNIFNNSPKLGKYLPVPSLWVYTALNILTHYICLSGVYSLQTATNSLTTTLALTVRKFISLLISIIYFKNEFTIFHWIGTILVFGGSLTFVWTASKQSSNNSQKKQN